MEIAFRTLTEEDFPEVLGLAREIWAECYGPILSREQIDYMLGEMYAPEVIGREQAAGVVWEFLDLDGRRAGYLSYVTLGLEVFLKKVYLRETCRGSGAFAVALDRVLDHARRTGADHLRLTVNRNNRRALAAYAKHGFAVREEAVVDIGGGFVMDDFILVKPLP